MTFVRRPVNYVRNNLGNVIYWGGFGWITTLIARIFFAHKTKRTHVMGVGLRISRVFGPRK